ncbi:MAG TPA: hypothetical protein VN613_05540 [Gemmatimonadaceae bacterium]|nr:hypothetical protein [Gemmatimonadaceae bacterium]
MRYIALATVAAIAAAPLHAQDSLAARPILSIGNYPSVNGLRLNFRDSDLGRVNGANVTVWSPYEPASGTVKGLALGLPVTGAGEIDGVAAGVFGVEASESIRGITFAPIGAGAGRDVSGIGFGGVGIGTGGDLSGIMIGGVGAGAGGSLKGIMIGGVGAGGGGDATGLLAGGVGAGVSGDVHGVLIGGVGGGAGGSIHGIAIGGVGAGAGGDIVGLAIGGIGIGAGGAIRGIAIGGIGVGAPQLSGGFVALAAGATDARGVVLAPAMFKIVHDGSFAGFSASAVNYIRGSQTGLTIGLVNYTRTLNGIQLGIINIVSDSRSHPVLPIINWGSGRD